MHLPFIIRIDLRIHAMNIEVGQGGNRTCHCALQVCGDWCGTVNYDTYGTHREPWCPVYGGGIRYT